MEADIQTLIAQLAEQKAALEALQQQVTTQNSSQQGQVVDISALTQLLPGVSTPPPQQFSFNGADWSTWITRFEQYREATKLKHMPQETQVNSFLYLMGSKANDILASMKISDKDSKSYDMIKSKFDSYYTVKKNKMYARAMFNQRYQKDGESADEYITDLHTLAKKCQYGALEDELIRDRIIAGMRNTELSRAIQNLQDDPSLESVINQLRHAEMVESNMSALNPMHNNNTVPPEVHLIKKKITFKKIETNSKDCCRKCGRSPKHKFAECEAVKSICKGCGIKGHWISVCRNKNEKKENNKVLNEIDNEGFFFGNIEKEETITIDSVNIKKIPRLKPKYTNVLINNCQVKFKIDTGASETVISPNLRIKLNLPEPTPVKEKLWGPCQIILPARGVCKDVKMTWQGKTRITDIYVLNDQDTPLLGLPECDAFGIIKWHEQAQILNISKSTLPEVEYSQLFEGLGVMEGKYSIQIKNDTTPYAVAAPRHISIPLKPHVEKTLLALQDLKVIEPVTHASEWCAPMVPVVETSAKHGKEGKPDKVRITIDYTELNKAILREYHPLPTVEECLAQLAGAKVFSKVDATKSYFQVELTDDSKDLTTFITPFGRFRFNRMPMGMRSSSEVFQRKMAMLLGGLKGCVNHVDDTLVFGQTIEEHDANLREVLKALHKGGVTLNKEKCIFRTTECTFLGYKITSDGVHPLQNKVKAITDLPIPKDLTALRSFMGAVNQHLRFMPNTAEVTKPLRDLLKKDSPREWTHKHTAAFENVKKLLTSSPQLAHYDPKLETRVTADASQYGTGAVLEQKHGNEWKPVHFWSAAFTPTQQRYAMVEKEACAITMACERFKIYLQGLPTFTVRTDHKPLVSILGSKPIADLSTRLQRFRMRMTPFNYQIEHVPGKYMYTADMLSRAPLPTEQEDKDILEEDQIDKMTFLSILKEIPMSIDRLEKIKKAQQEDKEESQKLKEYIRHGWPHYRDIEKNLSTYYQFKENLCLIDDDIISFKHQLFIPLSLRHDMLMIIHTGHVSIFKSQQRAKLAVWWPSINTDIESWCKNCNDCIKVSTQRPEPLMPGEVPEYPWEVIAADLCTYKGREYLVVRDILSNYPEVITLKSTTSSAIINHLKCIMARHGIPRILRSDNGPQFSSKQFEDFSKEWDFTHITSSPHFPQSNGAAEIGVKIIKSIFDRNPEDPLLGLLNYRTTPTQLGPAPAQISMSRLLNTKLPIRKEELKPKLQDLDLYRDKLKKRRNQSKQNFDIRHKVKELPELINGTKVHLTQEGIMGKVVEKTKEPRSYLIETEKGNIMRKNRRHVIELKETAPPYKPGSQIVQHFPSPALPASSRSSTPLILQLPASPRPSTPPPIITIPNSSCPSSPIIPTPITVEPSPTRPDLLLKSVSEHLPDTAPAHEVTTQGVPLEQAARQTITRSGRVVRAPRHFSNYC